jgi:integrase
MTTPTARSPNQRIALTQARVARLRTPPSGRLTVHDSVLPGLSVRVTAAGVKTFSIVKKVAGRPIRVTLGRFPTLTVDKARRLASGHLGDMAGGVDPNQVRREQEALHLPLRDALDEYKRTREGKVKPKTLSEYTRMFGTYFHDWMDRPVVGISRDMVQRRHAKVTAEHGPGAANHSMRALRAVLNFVRDRYETAGGQSILPDNPVRRLTAVRAWNRVERRRTLLADHDVPQWWDGLQQLREKFSDAADLFTLCFLTGMRPGEAARLRVDKVDLVARTLMVEDTKNREPLVLPLTTHVFDLLERRVQAATGHYVFAGPGRTGHLIEWKKGAAKLRTFAKLPDWIVYDLRRTYLTCAEGLDLAPYALKALVNHKQPDSDVTGGYLRMTPERLRKPAQLVEDKLLRLAKVMPGAEVLQFPRPGDRGTASLS